MNEQDRRAAHPSSRNLPAIFESIRKAAREEVSTAQPDDQLVIAERKALEAEKLRIENEQLRQKLRVAEDLHEVRKKYTSKLFYLIVCWLFVVVVYVGLAATQAIAFSLSDAVIIAFITSTTVSVIGLFVLVAKWLFPSPHKHEPEDDK